MWQQIQTPHHPLFVYSKGKWKCTLEMIDVVNRDGSISSSERRVCVSGEADGLVCRKTNLTPFLKEEESKMAALEFFLKILETESNKLNNQIVRYTNIFKDVFCTKSSVILNLEPRTQ